jgi:hypothetical protein
MPRNITNGTARPPAGHPVLTEVDVWEDGKEWTSDLFLDPVGAASKDSLAR